MLERMLTVKNEPEIGEDSELPQRLAKTLDQSLHEIDAISLQRLKKSRAQALAYSVNGSRRWFPASAAAGFMLLVAIPVFWQASAGKKISDMDNEIISQDIPLAVQDLDDLDMLIALEDGDV